MSAKQKAHAAKLRRYNKALQKLPGAKKLKESIFGKSTDSYGGKKKKKKKAGKKKVGSKKKKKKKAGTRKATASKRPTRRKTHLRRGKAYAQQYGKVWYYNNSKGKFVRWSDGSKTKRDAAKKKKKKK